MTTGYWESKYKTCRAAFLEMSRYWKQEKKESVKERQRIIQLCYDGIKMFQQPACHRNYEKILGILKVEGYEPPTEILK